MADDLNLAKDLVELNERVFGVIGVWPLRLNYVKFTIWVVYLLIHMATLSADLLHVFGNLELMVENLTESAPYIMILIKLMVMGFSQTLVKLTRRVVDDVNAKRFENDEEMKIYLQYARSAKRFFEVWLIMGISSAIAYNLRPMQRRLIAVLRNESMPLILAHHTRFFFEITESSTFWLLWIYQWPIMCMAVFHTAAMGYLVSLVLHVCGHLSVLVYRIKNLNFDPRDNHEIFRTMFRDIVNRNRDILQLTRDINRVFGLPLLEEVLITTILLGLIYYTFILSCEFGDIAVSITYLMYGVTMLVMIYGYCAAGEYLIAEKFQISFKLARASSKASSMSRQKSRTSTNLYEAYYQCQWYNVSSSFKKQLIICMIAAKKPIQLNAYGIYDFSLASFMNIVKTAAGYISMLRTLC